MATLQEIRDRKQTAFNNIYNHIRKSDHPVRVVELHHLYKNVWGNPVHFAVALAKNAPKDIHVVSKRRLGTFLSPIPKLKNVVKTAIMGGLFPTTLKGRFTNLKPEDVQAVKVNKIPKTFQSLPETEELYRIDYHNQPSKYIQTTRNGNFIFEQV